MSASGRSVLLDPLVEQQLALRQRLAGFGQALAFGRATTWAIRGMCLGLVLDVLLLLARWLGQPLGPATPELPLVLALPTALAILGGSTALARSEPLERVARQLDARLGLAERALTALAAPRDAALANPLHLWQLRDAVQHLERRDPLEAFPIPFPQRELLAALTLAVTGLVLWTAPSPFPPRDALNARGQLVRDEAERLTRVAQSLAEDPLLQSRGLEEVRELLRQAAQRLDAQLDNPADAAASLEEIERQLQAMANADQELAAALASVASALASSAETRDLSLAIRSGDLREVARAARDMARQAEGMSSAARARTGRVLRSAGLRPGANAAGLGQQLQQAGDGLEPSGSDDAALQSLSEAEALARAQAALRQLAESAAAAAARQRAQAALEGARNTLSRGQGRVPQADTMPGPGAGVGQRGGEGEPLGGSGTQPGEGEEGGTGFGTGTQNREAAPSRIDSITRPEQVTSGRQVAPDELGEAPLLQAPAGNEARVGESDVQAQFNAQPATESGQNIALPLGLRELVKEYFSAQEVRP